MEDDETNKHSAVVVEKGKFLNISQEMTRTVRCPLCSAEAGEKCLGVGGNHRERANYFKELAIGRVFRLPEA